MLNFLHKHQIKIAIFAVGLLLRLVYLARYHELLIGPDARLYLNITHGSLAIPLFPICCYLLHYNYAAILGFNVLLELWVLFYVLWRGNALAGLLYAFDLLSIQQSHCALTETLFIFLLTWFVYVRNNDDRWSGILSGLLLLTRPIWYYAIVIFVVFKKHKLTYIWFPLFCVLIWSWHNYLMWGVFDLTSQMQTYFMKYDMPPDWVYNNLGILWPDQMKSAMMYFFKYSLRYGDFPLYQPDKGLLNWIGVTFIAVYSLWIYAGVLLALILNWRKWWYEALTCAWLAFLPIALKWGNVRYRIPSHFIFCLMAGWSWTYAYYWWKERKKCSPVLSSSSGLSLSA